VDPETDLDVSEEVNTRWVLGMREEQKARRLMSEARAQNGLQRHGWK